MGTDKQAVDAFEFGGDGMGLTLCGVDELVER